MMLGNPQSQEEDQKTKATYANTFMSFQDPDALAAQEAKAQQVANMNRNLAVAQLDPRQAPVFFAGQAGDAVAGGLNKFFGNSQDTPTVAKARMEAGAIKNALETTKGIGDRKERFKAIGDYLMDNGLQSRAQEAYARYQELVDSELKATQTRAKIGEINADTRKKGLEGDQLVPKEVYRQSLIKLGYPVPAIDKAMETYDPATGRTGSPEVLQQRLGDSVYGALEAMVVAGKPILNDGIPQMGQKILSGPGAGEYKMFKVGQEKGVNITNINNIPKNEKAVYEVGGDIYSKINEAVKGYKYSYEQAGSAIASAQQAIKDNNPQAGVAVVQQLAQAIQKGDWSRKEVEELGNAGNVLQRLGNTLSKGVTGVALEKTMREAAEVAAQIQRTAGTGSRDTAGRISDAYARGNVSGDAIAIGRAADFTQRNPQDNGNSTDPKLPVIRGPIQRDEVAARRRASDKPKEPQGQPVSVGKYSGIRGADGVIKIAP
jgi:hypothetical protein